MMKAMRVILSGLLAFGSLSVYANDMKGASGQAQSAEQKLEKLDKELDLTSTQKEQVRTLLDEKMSKKAAATTDQEMQALKDEYKQKIRALLTDEQKTKYDSMKEDWEHQTDSDMKEGTDSGKPSTGY
jgi:periplasmic protein CpxP/Spy